MRAVLLPVIFLALAPAAHASSWTPAKTFAGARAGRRRAARRDHRRGVEHGRVAARRRAARDERRQRAGRFRAPKVIAERPLDCAVAPGRGRLRGQGRHPRRTSAAVTGAWRDQHGSEINGVAIAADPLGGYVIAER